jgi:hypothetical protein
MERKSPDNTLHVRLEPELRSQLEALAREEFGKKRGSLSLWVHRALRAEAAKREQQGSAAA